MAWVGESLRVDRHVKPQYVPHGVKVPEPVRVSDQIGIDGLVLRGWEPVGTDDFLKEANKVLGQLVAEEA